jgi:hypothetical protein
MIQNDEINLWKETVVKCVKYYPNICLQGLRKTTRNLSLENRPESQGTESGLPEHEADYSAATVDCRNREISVCESMHHIVCTFGCHIVREAPARGFVSLSTPRGYCTENKEVVWTVTVSKATGAVSLLHGLASAGKHHNEVLTGHCIPLNISLSSFNIFMRSIPFNF